MTILEPWHLSGFFALSHGCSLGFDSVCRLGRLGLGFFQRCLGGQLGRGPEVVVTVDVAKQGVTATTGLRHWELSEVVAVRPYVESTVKHFKTNDVVPNNGCMVTFYDLSASAQIQELRLSRLTNLFKSNL